jgi:hypothetical protein
MIESMPASLAIAQAERRVLEARLEKTIGACEGRVGIIAAAAEREIARLHAEIDNEAGEKEALARQLQQHATVIQNLSGQVHALQQRHAQPSGRLSGGYARVLADQTASLLGEDDLQLPLPPWDPIAAPASSLPLPLPLPPHLLHHQQQHALHMPGLGGPISPLKSSNAWARPALAASSSASAPFAAGEIEAASVGVSTGLDHSALSLQNSFEAYLKQVAVGEPSPGSAPPAFRNRLGLGFPLPPLQGHDFMLTRGQVLAQEPSAAATAASSTAAAMASGEGEGTIDLQTSAVLLDNLQKMMALHNLGPLCSKTA